ncbi:MAG TPA: NAD(P)H-binding protein [Myxococcales bacterium]|nr:NAD(P)H-binding protein [Myxococcales bacterium]
MKVLILGGTGATGRHLCEKAAADGHAVTALVRDSATAKLSFPGLAIRQGQATSQADVDAAVPGNDAVLSALGPRQGADPVCASAAQAVVAAMKKHGVKRLIWLSAGGVGDSAPQIIRASFVFGRIVMPLFLRKPYANHARAEEFIRASGLDFTVVRPVQLVDGPTEGKVVAVPIGAETLGSLKVARSAVAAFMIEELAARKFVGQMPLLHG